MANASPTSLSPLVLQMLADAAPAALNSLPRFSVGMLADLLWSYAAVGVKDDALLTAAAQVGIIKA